MALVSYSDIQETVEIFINGAWYDLSGDVVSAVEAELGMVDESYGNRLADPGTLTFDLDNTTNAYNPTVAAGKGAKIRLQVTYKGITKTKFYGTIDDIEVDAGITGEQRVHVTCRDWLGFSTEQKLRDLPIAIDKRINEAAATLLNSIPIQPLETSFDAGTQVFPTVFGGEGVQSTVYRELNNLVMSEFSYGYLDKGGERLRIEAYDTRTDETQIAQIPTDDGSVLLKADGFSVLKPDGGSILLPGTKDAAFTGLDIISLDAVHGKHIINEAAFKLFPRDVDTSNVVLFTLEKPLYIPASTTIEITGYFSDPTGGARISATNLQTPTKSAFANQDGTGTDYSANITITQSPSSDRNTYSIANAGVGAWVTVLTQTGYGIYTFNPIEIVVTDDTSADSFGLQVLSINQPYQEQASLAITETAKIVDIEKTPRTVVIKAGFIATASNDNMNAFMYVDIGSLIHITNTKPAVSSYFYVNGMTYKLHNNGVITFEWILKELPGFSAIAVDFNATSASQNSVNFGIVPRLANLLQKSYTARLYLRNSSTAPLMGKYSGAAQNVLFLMSSDKLTYVEGWTGAEGQWSTTNAVMSGIHNQWVHLGVTLDNVGTFQPIFYVNGVQKPLTVDSAPTGLLDDDSGINFMVGNSLFPGSEYAYNLDGLMKDVRVYDRIVTSGEMLQLAQNDNDYTLVTDGLILNGFFVRDFRYDDYVPHPISPEMKILDKIYKTPAVAHYLVTESNSNAIKGADPEAVSY